MENRVEILSMEQLRNKYPNLNSSVAVQTKMEKLTMDFIEKGYSIARIKIDGVAIGKIDNLPEDIKTIILEEKEERKIEIGGATDLTEVDMGIVYIAIKIL